MKTKNVRRSTDELLETRSELVARAAEEYLSQDNPGDSQQIELIAAKYPDIAEIIRDSFQHLAAFRESNRSLSSNREIPDDINEAFWREILSVGRIDEYRILRHLGSGAMGTVFEGIRDGDQEPVALKFLLPFSSLGLSASTRFQKEVRAMACVRHPHVVSLLATGQYRGIPYCVLELIRGNTLAQLIAHWVHGHTVSNDEPQEDDVCTRTAPISPPNWYEIAKIGYQAALGIEHAHERGVIHRDLKPANIMLDVGRDVKVTDFGLAYVEGDPSLTTADVLLGTVRYMSPEQVRGGDRVDAKSDIYSLAVTLYELSALRPPFPTADRVQLLHQVSFEEPAPIRKFRPDIPRDFETILHVAMAKRPQDRYATAMELAADLRRFMDGTTIRARKPSPLDRLAKVITQYPRGASAALAAIVLALAMLTLGLIWAQNATIRETQLRKQAESTKSLNDRLLYAADVRIAASSLKNKNVLTAARRLQRHIPSIHGHDHRNFAWHYVWNEVHSEYISLDAGEELLDVTWSPNGDSVAVGGISGKISFWDTRSRSKSSEYQGHQESVHDLEYSRDGRWLASGADDGTITLWDVQHSKVVSTFKAESEYGQVVCFSADGETLFSAGSRTIFVWKAPWKNPVAQWGPHPGTIYDLAVSKSGLELAVASGNQDGYSPGAITLRNIAQDPNQESENYGIVVAELKNGAKCTAVEWIKDDKVIAVGDQVGGLSIWERANLERPKILLSKHTGNVVRLSCSQDERWLVSASKDATARVWDTSTWEVTKTLQSHTGRVHAAEFSSVADQIVSTGADRKLKFWHPQRSTYRERQIGANAWNRVLRDPTTASIFLNSAIEPTTVFSVAQNCSLPVSLFPAQLGAWIEPNLLWMTSGGESLTRIKNEGFEDLGGERLMQFDVDADGDFDRVAGFGKSGKLILQENVGNSKFGNPRLYVPSVPGNFRNVNLDLNDDGICDRFGLGVRAELMWIHGASKKMQTISQVNRQQSRGNSYGIADMNADGKLDVILLDSQSGMIESFQPVQNGDEMEWKSAGKWHPGAKGIYFLETLDVNADAARDIVLVGDGFVACYSGPDAEDYELLSGKQHALVSPRLIQSWAVDLGLGKIDGVDANDVNGDGLSDLILASTSGIWYYGATPDGVFSVHPISIGSIVDADWVAPIPCNVAKVDIATQSVHTLLNVPGGVSRMAWSPARETLVTIGEDHIIRFWDDKGKHTGSLRLESANIPCIAFSPDGKLLAVATGDNILIIDPIARMVKRTCRGHQTTIHALAFSHDSQQLVTVSGDLTARTWDVVTGASLHVLAGHNAAPISVEYSPDDEMIASGDILGCVRLWDAQSGDELLELSDFKYRALSVAFETPMKLVVVGNNTSTDGSSSATFMGEWEVTQ